MNASNAKSQSVIADTNQQSQEDSTSSHQTWETVDGWLIVMTLLGCMSAAYGGWALEDLYSLRIQSKVDFLNLHLVPLVFSIVSCFSAMVFLVYSTSALRWRHITAAGTLTLVICCFMLAVGAFRHPDIAAIYRPAIRRYYISGLAGVPISFLLISWWLQNIFGPLKFQPSNDQQQMKAVDFRFQVTRFRWVLSLCLLFVLWFAFQFPTMVTNSDFFVPSIVGGGLAVGFYIYLNLAAMVSSMPGGRFFFAIVSLLISGGFEASLAFFGRGVFKHLLVAEPYLTPVLASAFVSVAAFSIWAITVAVFGRTPRRLKSKAFHEKIHSKKKPHEGRNKIPSEAWSNHRRLCILSAGGMVAILLAHYVPFYFDLPLTLAQSSASYPNARLAADVRHITGSLVYRDRPGQRGSRITVSDDLSLPAILRISSQESNSPEWQERILAWEHEGRMPSFSCIDEITTLDQLKIFGVESEHINGSKIDSSLLKSLEQPLAPTFDTVTLSNAHVDQNWMDFLAEHCGLLNFRNCTFDPKLQVPQKLCSISYTGEISEEIHLEVLLHPDRNLSLSTSRLEDITLPAEKLITLLIRAGISIAPNLRSPYTISDKSHSEFQANTKIEFKKHLEQLGYSEADRHLISERLVFSGTNVGLEKLHYGVHLPLPVEARLRELATDSSGQLVRISMPNSRIGSNTNLAITNQLLNSDTLEVLEFEQYYYSILAQAEITLPKLHTLRFASKEHIDPNADQVRKVITKLLPSIQQSKLEELELPCNLANVIGDCEPWPNLKRLSVVLQWPPSIAEIDQIKTAENLELLIICNQDGQAWDPANVSRRKQKWQNWLTENEISVPTKLVYHPEQMSVNDEQEPTKAKSPSTAANDKEAPGKLAAPVIEYNIPDAE